MNCSECQSSRNGTGEAEDSFLSTLKPNYPQWIAILIVETVFLVFGVYLLIAFIYFAVKNASDSNSSTVPGGKRLRRIRNYLLLLLIIYTISSLFKFCLAHWVYWGPPISNSTYHCAFIAALYQPFHCLGVTTSLLFLWLRQHSLQQGSKYLTSPSPYIMRFSWLFLAIIISGGAIAIIVVMVSNSPELFLYIQGTNACSYARSFGLNAITLYVGAAAVIGMQVGILFLFVLVLRRNRKRVTAPARKMSVKASPSKSTTQRRIQTLIRNCTIAAAITSASTIAIVFVDVFARGTVSQLVVNATGDIDNAISLASIVFCFSNWKELLLPWPCFQKIIKVIISNQNTSSVMEI